MYPSITTIFGAPGTRKTTISITWPTPIAFYNLEHGGHRAWNFNALKESGDITVRSYPIPHRSMVTRYEKLSGYMDAWKKLTSDMESDLAKCATVVWDTGTVVWALDRDAMLEEIQATNPTRKQLQQIEFGEPNRRITELFNLARAFQTNLVITHHETDEYINVFDPLGRPIMDEQGHPVSIASGKKVPEGFKHTIGLSDWVLRTKFVDTMSNGTTVSVPTATIEKSAYGLHLRGTAIDWATYDKLSDHVS